VIVTERSPQPNGTVAENVTRCEKLGKFHEQAWKVKGSLEEIQLKMPKKNMKKKPKRST
jgi:hypothetical protein